MNTLTQLEFPIPEAVHSSAWQQSQSYSTPRTQWTAYLNQVCLTTLLPWIQEEYDPNARVDFNAGGIVNGSVVSCNQKSLVLIPERNLDTSELRVPQEWVDVPSWVGDYYLAVQVNPDERSLLVWAYTTHEQLKTQGQYEDRDRTYTLDSYSLIQDIGVLWVVQQLHANEPTQVAVPAMQTVPPAQAENLLQRLSNSTIDQPRLEVPFSLWGALLQSDRWYSRFNQLRQQQTVSSRVVTNLRQWLQNTLTEGWQALESVLTPEEVAFSLRSDASATAIRRVKTLNLAGQDVLLVISLTSEPDGRIGVRIQLRPAESTLCLPENLTLSLLSATGATIQSIQTRSQDNSIQLQRFKCPSGTQFEVQIAVADVVMVENFQC